MKVFNNLYEYRELLKSNIKKEIRGKYKGSTLGVLWSFINPLLQVVVYAIVFRYIMRFQIPNYTQFIICGIIPWTFFTNVINQGTTTVRANAGIIKKVYFPREILPISVAVSGLINFLISCIIVLIFCVPVVGLSWHLVFVPLIALIQSMFTLGLVFALSAINIYVKDVEYIVTFILNMLFYGTTILYDASMFASAPAILMTLVKMNPLTVIIGEFRSVFLYHEVPALMPMLIVGLLSFAVLLIGYQIFRKLERGFAEEV